MIVTQLLVLNLERSSIEYLSLLRLPCLVRARPEGIQGACHGRMIAPQLVFLNLEHSSI
ncbi:unnamed protein product [Ectocarpus sp. CCAP 1310/34]|nr:unnamed protein product [Ectocarpus sp. CCAP 1310/34]